MNKFLSRKLLVTIGVWLYSIGGIISGQIDTKTGLEAIGLSGIVYIVAEGLIDMVKAWVNKK